MDFTDELSMLVQGIVITIPERPSKITPKDPSQGVYPSAGKKAAFFPKQKNPSLDSFLKTDFEIEALIGRYMGNRFIPGVEKSSWNLLLKYFLSRDFMQYERTHTIDARNGDLRRTTYDDGSVVYQRKSKGMKPIDVVDWNYRINASKEVFINPSDVPKGTFDFADRESVVVPQDQDLVIRNKTRHTFRRLDYDDKVFSNMTIDLTYVVQDNGRMVRQVYEVEIERDEGMDKTLFIRSIQAVLVLLSGVKEEVILKEESGSTVVDGFHNLVDARERALVVSMWNNLFKKDIDRMPAGAKKGFQGGLQGKLYNAKNKPVPIRTKDLTGRVDYAVTVKYDGVRALVLFAEFGTYIVDAPFNITSLGYVVKDEVGTVLDGEMLSTSSSNTYYPFDILFKRGRDLRGLNFMTRLDTIKNLNISSENLNIQSKQFFREDSLVKSTNLAYNELLITEAIGIPTDGLIFQPLTKPYYISETVKKWKPPEKLTIDFLTLKDEENSEEFQLYLYGKNNSLERFVGTKKYPYDKLVRVPQGLFRNEPIDQQIVEMGWDRENENFTVVKIRSRDRTDPNFIKVGIDVWNDIHNPILLSTILFNDMKIARTYSNDVKRTLLRSYFKRGEVILDIGSGRGGDLMKWGEIGFERVLVVEPNIENLKILNERAKALNATDIDVLVIGAEGTEGISAHMKRNKYNRVDGVTAFFSLTFFGESKEKMTALVESIDRVLKENGVLLGIVLDGDRVSEMFGNDANVCREAWSISRDEWGGTPFGNEIITNINDADSMVRNVKEYLFDFDVFREMLKRKSIHLQLDYFLGDSRLMSEQQNEFMGMNRAFIFVKQPPLVYDALLPINVGEISSVVTPFEYDIVRIGTPGEGSCFFHSVVGAFSERYKRMNVVEKNDFIARFRRNLAADLDYDVFTRLGNGVLAEFMEDKYKGQAREGQAKRLGWLRFLEMLKDCREWIGEEMIEYVSNTLGLDIYILNDRTRNVRIGQDCDILYKHRPSIVIVNIDNMHYETVGVREEDRVKTVFNPNDPFIKQIHKEACGSD